MIEISSTLSLDESELEFAYIRASGPGGQNVNKASTAVQLRFDVSHSPSLPAEVKERLTRLGGSRMTYEGVLVIVARRYRTQEQNRTDATQRLTTLIHKALEVPPQRVHTRPTASARAARLEAKKQHGQLKRNRQSGGKDWE